MINAFRKTRKLFFRKKKFYKYLLYAFGEIILVVIGILIALQINNWNEQQKQKEAELYLLGEIKANLVADSTLIDQIITQRRKTQQSINNMSSYLRQTEINRDTFAYDMVQLNTFERYFPIKTAYEMSKTRGLPLSNNTLRTKIANYYEYEQLIIQRGTQDIEKDFINEIVPNLRRYIKEYEYGKSVTFKNHKDPKMINWLSQFLVSFNDNNESTLRRLERFFEINEAIKRTTNQEIKKLE